MVEKLKKLVLEGGQLDRAQALWLMQEAPLEPLCQAADQLRAERCGDRFDLCAIVNGKSGHCSENCRFCAQSAHYSIPIDEYQLLDTEELVREADKQARAGVLRFSVVTSGRCLTDAEVDQLCGAYRKIHESCGIGLCASHGLLTAEQFVRLREAGVERCHNNLETSRRYFAQVCSTHTYEDKLEAIANARAAGLNVCSGGIIGMGETPEDRIDLALELRALGVQSMPVNILSPVKGTPFADLAPLGADEVRRTVAVFRFILPDAAIRLAGGRGQLADKGRAAFQAGANAAITGDMLTTSGIDVRSDCEMLGALGYRVAKL